MFPSHIGVLLVDVIFIDRLICINSNSSISIQTYIETLRYRQQTMSFHQSFIAIMYNDACLSLCLPFSSSSISGCFISPCTKSFPNFSLWNFALKSTKGYDIYEGLSYHKRRYQPTAKTLSTLLKVPQISVC